MPIKKQFCQNSQRQFASTRHCFSLLASALTETFTDSPLITEATPDCVPAVRAFIPFLHADSTERVLLPRRTRLHLGGGSSEMEQPFGKTFPPSVAWRRFGS